MKCYMTFNIIWPYLAKRFLKYSICNDTIILQKSVLWKVCVSANRLFQLEPSNCAPDGIVYRRKNLPICLWYKRFFFDSWRFKKPFEPFPPEKCVENIISTMRGFCFQLVFTVHDGTLKTVGFDLRYSQNSSRYYLLSKIKINIKKPDSETFLETFLF